jgi:hypothetical protein
MHLRKNLKTLSFYLKTILGLKVRLMIGSKTDFSLSQQRALGHVLAASAKMPSKMFSLLRQSSDSYSKIVKFS